MHKKSNFIKALLLIIIPFLATTLSANAGIVNTEKSFVIPLNDNWLFGGEFQDSFYNPEFDDSGFKTVTIPHCVTGLSWQNWDVNCWQYVYGYRKHFSMPTLSSDQRVILHFDGVMVGATPCINGHKLPFHLGGYLPFEYDITPYIKQENVLTVAVDSRWSNVPPQGAKMGPARIDYLEPGGIHRSVSLKVVPQTYIKDVYCIPSDVLEKSKSLQVKTTLDAAKVLKGNYKLVIRLEDEGKCIASASQDFKPK
ncbi:MAG: sugar-binding domain-containing protein, partial [Candidatus Cryptobacteroides sp.]